MLRYIKGLLENLHKLYTIEFNHKVRSCINKYVRKGGIILLGTSPGVLEQ